MPRVYGPWETGSNVPVWRIGEGCVTITTDPPLRGSRKPEGSALAEFLAIHQSDASLLGCILRRLAGKVSLGSVERATGVGFFQSDDVLVRKRPSAGKEAQAEKLAEGIESEAALICNGAVGTLNRNASFNEQTALPFRFKKWLFSAAGQPERLAP